MPGDKQSASGCQSEWLATGLGLEWAPSCSLGGGIGASLRYSMKGVSVGGSVGRLEVVVKP